MSYLSNWLAIRQECSGIVQAITLSGIASDAYYVRMMPKTTNDNVGKTPCVIFAPYGDLQYPVSDMEGGADVEYLVEVALVAPSNFDVESNQDLFQSWQMLIINAIMYESAGVYRTTMTTVLTVWNIEVVDAPTFDRSLLSNMYAYQSIVFRFTSHEGN